MRVIIQVVEAIEVIVPDLLTLGLSVPAFFSLYRSAVMLGLPGTRDMCSALLISLALGYVTSLALNVAGAMTLPARPGLVSLPQWEPRVEQLARESAPYVVKTQTVREGMVTRQETDLFEQVPR